MKAQALLGLLFVSCGGNGELWSDGGTGVVVGDRADVHAEFEDLRQARKERMPLGGGGPRAGRCKKLTFDLTDIDPDRSLFVHDSATLGGADFSLRRVLTRMAEQAVQGGADPGVTTAESLFSSMWQAQSPIAPEVTCPDSTGLVNGFPYDCRDEGGQILDPAIEIDKYIPIALVNRMDNTSDDFGDCGEHRIVFARTPELDDRNFIIFEAVLPNPLPGCMEGCRTVARWWADLSNEADPLVRATKLEQLYFRPLGQGPKGYRAVVHIDHYSMAGVDTLKLTSIGGQIRTNQRMMDPWQLKEYKTAVDCSVQPCTASVVPVSVKVNPFENLFDSNEELAGQPWSDLVPLFQDDFLLQREQLAGGITAIDFTYEADPLFDGGQGTVKDFFSHYDTRVDAVYRAELDTDLPVGFTSTQLVNRATALNCAGCHDPRNFDLDDIDSIGPGLAFPDNQLRFVHTNDVAAVVLPPASVFGDGTGFELSDALNDHFLPSRAQVLLDFLNQDVCICQPPAPMALSGRGRGERDALARSAADELDHAMAQLDAIRADNDALEAAGIAVDRSDEIAALDAIDDVVRNSGQAMLSLLAREGVEDAILDQDRFAATPFRTAGDDDLAAAIQDAINAQPPRRTITGSFNAH